MKYEGFVAAIFGRDVQSKRKGWPKSTSYSFKLENADGTEQPEWIGYGFEEPPFKQGDYITVEAEKNDRGFLNYIKGTGQQVKNPPARAAAKPAGSNGVDKAVVRDTAESVASEVVGASPATADRQTQIVLQHSQEMAISAVSVLLTHDGLPMSEAKSKAGTAKRFDEIRAMIDKMTRKFYDDVVTGQLLTTVAPELVSTEPDAPLPEPATQKPKQVNLTGVTAVAQPQTIVIQPGVF